jgi:adenosylmethionine-8-amino-7-oxononanoate aminotransferase
MAVSGRSVFTRPFENHFFGVDFVPFPATWDDDPDRDEKERRALAALDETLDRNNGRHAALIIEPLIQGAGGMRMCSTGFLQKAVDKAREHDLLVIFDEVMTGFGRTGEWFACVKTGTVPDLLCLSKCLTGGFLPLAVTACTESVAEPFLDADPLKTFYHGHSYTANPLGCAAALASIDLLSRNESRFREIERRHRKRLRRFEKDPRVEKLRACGNVAAMDVAVEGNGGYLNRVGPRIKAALLEAGIFLRPLGNVLYLMPPLCIRDEDLDTVYGAIERVLKNL